MKRNSKPIGDLKREQFSVQASVFRGARNSILPSIISLPLPVWMRPSNYFLQVLQ